jgi:hypothetical protein
MASASPQTGVRIDQTEGAEVRDQLAIARTIAPAKPGQFSCELFLIARICRFYTSKVGVSSR